MFKKLMCLFVMVFAFMASTCSAASLVSDNDGYIDLPITSMMSIDADSGTPYPLTTSTKPGIEQDNLLPSLVWSDGETTPALITFQLPDDYKTGGLFKVFADESDSTTPNQIDFYVLNNRAGVIWDTAATNQTPVALAGTAGTPDLVELLPATDMDGAQAGDFITLALWRDDTASGTGDLEVYNVRFYYKKKIK